MTIVWDMWQYRNSLVHAEDGPLRTDEKLTINNSIKAQFFIGGGDLLEVDQFLFEDYSLEGLLKSDVPTKLLWRTRVAAARRAVNLNNNEEVNGEEGMYQLTLDEFGWVH